MCSSAVPALHPNPNWPTTVTSSRSLNHCFRFQTSSCISWNYFLLWGAACPTVVNTYLCLVSVETVGLALAKVVLDDQAAGASTDVQLVHSAIRQNVKGRMCQVLSTLQWAHLTLCAFGVTSANLAWQNHTSRRDLGRQLFKAFDSICERYHNMLDEEGAHMDEAPAKRPRRGRRVRAVQNPEVRDAAEAVAQVRLGTSRQTAIKNLLMYATDVSFQCFEKHISYIGGISKSAISDALLSCKTLWPGSNPSDAWLPTAAEEVTRNASRKTEVLPKKLTSAELQYNQPLTPEQHNDLVSKLLSTFEEQLSGALGQENKTLYNCIIMF